MLERLGRMAARRHWRVIIAWIVIGLVVVTLAGKYGGKTNDNFAIPGTTSDAAQNLLQQNAPGLGNANVNVVYQVATGSVTDPANQAAIQNAITALKAIPNVANVSDPFTPILTGSMTPQNFDAFVQALGASPDVKADRIFPNSLSADGKTALVSVQMNQPATELPKDSFEQVQAAARTALPPGMTAELGGALVDLQNPPPPGISQYADEIGLLFAVIILLIALGSLTAMVVPVGVAVFGIVISSSLLALAEGRWSIGSAAPELGLMIGLGVGIDYSLFIVNRYRQNLGEGMDVETAVGRAVSTSGSAVLFAAITVCLALVGLTLIGIPYVSTLGIAAAMFVAVTVAAALTVLPALLGLLGRKIDALRLPWHKPAEEETPDKLNNNLSAKWGREICKHPVIFAVVSVGLLLLISVPLLRIQLGIPDDSVQPGELTQTKAVDEISQAFGAGQNGPLLIVADLGPSYAAANNCSTGQPSASAPAPTTAPAPATPIPPAAVAAYVKTLPAETQTSLKNVIQAANVLLGTPGVKSVTPVPCTGQLGVAIVVPTTGPSDPATTELVNTLNQNVIPKAVQGTGLSPSNVYIGGATAILIDLTSTISTRMPYFVGAVLILSFFLLMMVFRSVFVPVKAVIMNLLSIGAALGFLVAVFQWGWLNWVFGVNETLAIVAFIPVMMFAVLFGLSMDYEVFLLSRIHEEWLLTKDHRAAVVNGIGSTARVITAAALIMISVFLTFAFNPSVVVKMLALGMAAAVFIDATIVRMIAVPSAMELAGKGAWWIPHWLDKVMPHINVDAPNEPIGAQVGDGDGDDTDGEPVAAPTS
ncbi:MAG: MMPL family transporter [Actinobacteria bacterium]|nr:MMPL family transporter [Actinomycetota bacterium]